MSGRHLDPTPNSLELLYQGHFSYLIQILQLRSFQRETTFLIKQAVCVAASVQVVLVTKALAVWSQKTPKTKLTLCLSTFEGLTDAKVRCEFLEKNGILMII